MKLLLWFGAWLVNSMPKPPTPPPILKEPRQWNQ